MKYLSLLLILISFSSFAQDKIPAKNGEITINPITHGTLVFEHNGQVIYVDPYGGAAGFAGQKKPTLVLITDIHGDHLNQETLDGLDLSGATFAVPQEVADKLPVGTGKSIEILSNDQSKTINGVKIDAIPMYNLPENSESRHPKGRGNGYIVNLGGKRLYLSGDTEDIKEMRSLKRIDVAFVCMNLPYTMDVDQAASAVSEFKPAVVYPYHYRGTEGLCDVEKFKNLVNASAPNVDVRLRNWYQ
ncbi:L-ascorbate metabolism protein UlaG (beta-lactamase superfamily) [Algoriphagus ratkowskyi]|uniref:L-ascorbate metabolism protein UlaG (Beta-lactamase superfamily) n=1 Tax=Algoriphagus ratkowskyi TaxID=57028 RepID=A0A2W7R0V9_9BACT|nr:MBL fold metallo-hydrolase [Algoriphagus ratkowskyi]PZX51840.1 L-ascorbate metabolism protein UlaG (beta-lactamase superfamily) [Algoriphagus ratkowskyi]TXD76025.1 MBL fold metallo-hydrolase [Algoriphagus ratkowskyi]